MKNHTKIPGSTPDVIPHRRSNLIARVIDYIQLTKPGVVWLILMSTVTSFYLASPEIIDLPLFFHAVMGTGGAPEGVLVAATMRCLNGEILARLVVATPEKEERCRTMGITDIKRVYRAADLACGRRIVFAATGVTDGTLMKGVRFFGDGIRTSSLIMQTNPQRIQFIDTL